MTEEDFRAELAFAPAVERPLAALPTAVVVGGMGGSALAGDALAFLLPRRSLLVHRDYDLPKAAPPDALYLAISYSGNTVETISFAEAALASGRTVAVVTAGGALADFARAHELPASFIPAGLPPRNALLYMVRAGLALLAEDEQLEELANADFDIAKTAEAAHADAADMRGRIPLFYSSERNVVAARIAKLVMNETARTPAFLNVFPELNHNEMQAFDTDMPAEFSDSFHFILITDATDDPRIVRRMQIFEEVMDRRGRPLSSIALPQGRAEAFVSAWLYFLLLARALGEARYVNPDTEPLIDEFKTLL